MSIKKIVKISFILILFVISVVAIINTIIIYQIKENNIAKQSINNLVSIQEKMNELLKDTININSIEKLDKAKDEFVSYEKEFEKIQDEFKQQDKNDLIDYLIKDISKNEFIANNLQLLFDSEHEIEKSFDAIYDLQEKKIDLIAQFDRDYPIENEIRKNLTMRLLNEKILNFLNFLEM